MGKEKIIEDIFESLFKDKNEKIVIRLIIEGKESEEIIEKLINSHKGK